MGWRRGTTIGSAAERRATLLAELRRVVLEGPARTEPAIRAAASTGGPLGVGRAADAGADVTEPMRSYAAKVRDASYRVTDADVAELRAAGISEDEIFEVTVAAALGAACRCLDAGLRALDEER